MGDVGDGRSNVDRLLDDARSRLDRVAPSDLDDAVAAGALVIDIRPADDIRAEGPLPDAIAVERIYLEWRLDPTSPHRLREAGDGRLVVIVCNEGYSSSLAAATLRQLGVRATDLDGGFRAWRALRPG